MAAGAVAAVQAMLRQSARMHVILLAITPRGERCASNDLRAVPDNSCADV